MPHSAPPEPERAAEPGRMYHDMGGLPAGPVETAAHDYALWEKRVDALMVLLSAPRRDLLKVDELRRNIESLGAEAYEAMSYYERWMAAIARVLIERGVVTSDEIGRKMAEIEARDRDEAE
jgi:nitrile hydratase subunit beta